VKAYVLRRANGCCEACGEEAPFVRKDGTPYLEPHHTRRVADGGPDHPAWVAAICPTCHRQIIMAKMVKSAMKSFNGDFLRLNHQSPKVLDQLSASQFLDL
jgi:hypothetical protein